MRFAPAVHLTDKDREWVTKQIKSTLSSKRLSQRCLVVLLAANAKTNEQIAKKLKITRQKVGRWRSRFAELGRAGIESDRPGRGRKFVYTAEIRRLIVQKTRKQTPKAATHWSRQSIGRQHRLWHGRPNSSPETLMSPVTLDARGTRSR